MPIVFINQVQAGLVPQVQQDGYVVTVGQGPAAVVLDVQAEQADVQREITIYQREGEPSATATDAYLAVLSIPPRRYSGGGDGAVPEPEELDPEAVRIDLWPLILPDEPA